MPDYLKQAADLEEKIDNEIRILVTDKKEAIGLIRKIESSDRFAMLKKAVEANPETELLDEYVDTLKKLRQANEEIALSDIAIDVLEMGNLPQKDVTDFAIEPVEKKT